MPRYLKSKQGKIPPIPLSSSLLDGIRSLSPHPAGATPTLTIEEARALLPHPAGGPAAGVPASLEETRALLPHPVLPAPSLGLEEARALLPHPRASEPGLSLLEARALFPHQPPAAPPPDDAQVVLASRVFGG